MVKVRKLEKGSITFSCPGCNEEHTITVDGSSLRANWSYNGNPESPTFTPSVLVRTGHYVKNHKDGDPCWCTRRTESDDDWPFKCTICHSFVTDGRIQFLSDCSHDLAGQTVYLLDIEDP